MNRLALLALLAAPALSLTVVAEQAAPAAPAQEQAAPLADRLRALLDSMEQSGKDDCYEAARLVVEETGTPIEFHRLMEQASLAGSAAATTWLAPVEISRLGATGQNLETAPRAIELRARVMAAADKGYAPAQLLVSRLAGMGVGAAADENLAMRYLMQACKQGNAQARAGYLIVSGRLQKGGIKAPEVAAELGRNNYHLEEIIAHGMGNTAEGISWLQKAREHGSASAPYLLSQAHSSRQDNDEALRCLEEAAQRHHLDAMAFLGHLKLNAEALSEESGVALQKDLAGGMQLLKMAAALGQPEAAQELATTCAQMVDGDGALPVQQICELYRMAAEFGEPHGMAGYGYCLLTGLGCTQDATRGEELLLKGIEKGAQWGHQALASACFNGHGVKPDMRRAISSLGEDAAVGSVHAYAIMAAIVALGNEGTAPDPLRARIYLGMAEAEDPEARLIYDSIIANKGWRFLPMLWK